MKPLLIVKTGATIPSLSHLGDFEDWIARYSDMHIADLLIVDVRIAADELPELHAVCGAIVTGSPEMVTAGEGWMIDTAAWCQRAIHAGLPILGICFGHQLLAYAAGGVVDWNPCGREIGTVNIHLTAHAESDPLLGQQASCFTANVSHSQSVIKLPDNAVRLAYNGMEEHHAFRLGDSAWGFQFHPEFNADVSRGYIQARAADLKAEGLDPNQLLSGVEACPESANLLKRFAALLAA